MSLLKALLGAIARGQVKPQNVIPKAPPTPVLVQAVVGRSPKRVVKDGTLVPPAFTDGSVQPPADRAVQAVYDYDLVAFLALPLAEQLVAIEAELAALPADQQRLILDTLRPELKRKWLPLPGPQSMALRSEADILLYGGSAGGGKTDLLIGLALTQHKRSLIMRRQYTDLSFICDRACEVNRTRDGFSGASPPRLRTGDGRFIEFGAASQAGDEESFQGRPHDLLAVDEAAQFLESQIRYLMGWVRTAEPGQRTRVILASNPPLSAEGQWLVRMFGPWLDPGHPKPAKPGELRWFITDMAGEDIEVDGSEPVAQGGRTVKPMSRTFIPAKLADNAYLTRTDDYASKLDSLLEPLRSIVRDGNFMAVRSDDIWQVIPSDWVRKAQARWKAQVPEKMTCLAADIAQGGDDQTVIAMRHGKWFAPLVVKKGAETPDGKVVGALIMYERQNNCQIVIDVGGGWGGDTVGRLDDNEVPTIGFRGADASSGKSVGSGLDFANMRAETYWRFREALDPANGENIALPPDQELMADLCAARVNSTAMQKHGKIQIESKQDIRERLGRSPDRADAVTMCWHYGGMLEHERKTYRPWVPRVILGHQNAKRRYG